MAVLAFIRIVSSQSTTTQGFALLLHEIKSKHSHSRIDLKIISQKCLLLALFLSSLDAIGPASPPALRSAADLKMALTSSAESFRPFLVNRRATAAYSTEDMWWWLAE